MSHYVLSKVIQIEMGSRQTWYCLNDYRFYTHSARETADLAGKGSAPLYLEIVRPAFQRHFTDIRFNPKQVVSIHTTILRPSYAFPHSCTIGVDNRAWNACQCAGKVVTFYNIPFISRLWHLVFSQVGSLKCLSFEFFIHYLEILQSFFDRHRPWIKQKRLFSFGYCLICSLLGQGKRK